MRKIISSIAGSILLFWTSFAQAEGVQFGVGLVAGQISADGTETEGTAADTSDRTKSFEEMFYGADLFVEVVGDNGGTIGLSYVPLDFEIGSGSRTDSAVATAKGGAENDTGTRTASADVSDLITLYANVPMGSNGWYALLGGHLATIKTSESLPNSSYGDEDVYGYQVGFGTRSGNRKIELSYSDFEDISIDATGGGTNSVSADADSLQLRISYGF
tara:strand:- start:19 stop:669 length:651 start_codon:yes stop_codon:yes gene_type:complete